MNLRERAKARQLVQEGAAPEPALPTAPVKREPPNKPYEPKNMSWARLSLVVSELTNGFQSVLEEAARVAVDPEVETRDKVKAWEFLSKFAEKDPATLQRNLTVSGPGGKAIPVAHAHAHVVQRVALPDLSGFTNEELVEYERLLEKAAASRALPAPAPPADVLDVEAE